MQITGYIRFSFLGQTDTHVFRAHQGQREALARVLYDPGRMAQRFHFFERLCLPSLAAQDDREFDIVILCSEAMPKPYLDRLSAATAPLPQCRIMVSDADNVRDALGDHIRAQTAAAGGPSIHFRLDDDDALSRHAIGALKALGAGAEPTTILTLPRGGAMFVDEGQPVILPRNAPFHSVGWARVSGPGDSRSPFRFAHQQAPQRFPTRTDPRPMSHIYVMHSGADTADRNAPRLPAMAAALARFTAEPDRARALAAEIDDAFPGIGHEGFVAAMAEAESLTVTSGTVAGSVG